MHSHAHKCTHMPHIHTHTHTHMTHMHIYARREREREREEKEREERKKEREREKENRHTHSKQRHRQIAIHPRPHVGEAALVEFRYVFDDASRLNALVESAGYWSLQTYLLMLFFYDGERFPDVWRSVEPATNCFQRHPSGCSQAFQFGFACMQSACAR